MPVEKLHMQLTAELFGHETDEGLCCRKKVGSGKMEMGSKLVPELFQRLPMTFVEHSHAFRSTSPQVALPAPHE